jgi:hypothetical protein
MNCENARMTRAKANPDPAVEEFTDARGRVFVIEARRDGAYVVRVGDKTVINRPPQLGAYFRAPLYPSNRLQDEAMAEAKERAQGLRDEQL